ncbi:alpha/beta hydrolase [Aspergillus undulatus]|uniref:alpha/beta hydrolase n=1 Tax=Aspergillus undulatus TaxID=1810928 RepID=UPI003CCDE2E4
MSLIDDPNPPAPVTIFNLIQTGVTICVRLPWVISTTLARRWWPWKKTYKPPPLREHLFRHVMTCLGNHVPLSVWQWYTASDTTGSNLTNSRRYGHIPHLFERVRTAAFCGYWICRGLSPEPTNPKDADLVLLHAHGGGYVAYHPSIGAPEHVFLAENLQKHGVSTAIFSLDYTLAPKAAFPTQRNEAIAAYNWLCGEMGVDPSKIVVIGDSAGGHLIMSLLSGLYERHQASQSFTLDELIRGDDRGGSVLRPAGAVLVSPWVNLRTDHPQTLELHWEERLHKRSLDTYSEWILRDVPPGHYDLLSETNFARGPWSWVNILPRRTLVTAGSEELVFLYDIGDFVMRAREDGADVVLEVAPGKNHTWQCAEAFAQQSRLLALGPDEELPGDLMEGYKGLAMGILNIIKGQGEQV